MEMDEEKRKKLVEHRKKRQEEKELTNSIAKSLHVKQRQNDIQAKSTEYENRFVEAIIIFFGTLIPLYVFIFIPFFIFNFLYGSPLSTVGIYIGPLVPYVHGGIYIASAVSVYQRKSLLDTFFDQFA